MVENLMYLMTEKLNLSLGFKKPQQGIEFCDSTQGKLLKLAEKERDKTYTIQQLICSSPIQHKIEFGCSKC